jgi:drug/metabolite transporter (DMT)-like permease
MAALGLIILPLVHVFIPDEKMALRRFVGFVIGFIGVFIIRGANPVFLSLTNYQAPLWSVVLGIILLAEPFQVNIVIAMILILLGLGLSQYGALKRLFKSRGPDQA